jgi:hypothetical protein
MDIMKILKETVKNVIVLVKLAKEQAIIVPDVKEEKIEQTQLLNVVVKKNSIL